jgi:amino acid transporter
VALVFIAIMTLITLINLIGITESVVVNVIMTFIELSGLVIVIIIGVIALVEGVNEPGVLLQFTAEGSPVIAVLAGVSLAFFAMTGFENAANVAEETIDPARAFPRALIGGMLTAGVVYVLVSISAALAMPIETLAGNTLLEVIRADLVFIPASIMIVIFGLIAMIAISNTTLVTVVFLLFIYALVIVACLKLRGKDEGPNTYRANTPLLLLGIVGNLAVLAYTVIDDPAALYWVAGLLAVGLVLYLLERFFGKKQLRPPGAERDDPEAADPPRMNKEH